MPEDIVETQTPPEAGNPELDALAIETGVVDDTPDPAADAAAKPDTAVPDPAVDKPAPAAVPEPEKKPESALEVVRKVMAQAREKDKPLDAAAVTDKPAPVPAAEDLEAAGKKSLLTKAEWAGLPERAKTRIGWLGNEVKRERAAREVLEPRAQMFDEMAGFVSSTGMSHDQFVSGLNIMGWINTDPAKAYEALKPIFADLQGYMGDLLPTDLQAQVDEGRITPELAQQLTFERSERTLLEKKNSQRNQYQEQLDTQRQADNKVAESKVNTDRVIAGWQRNQVSTDPDFRYKAAQISDRAYVMVMAEQPATDEALLNLLNRAKGDVDKRIGNSQNKRAITPVNVPSAGGTVNRQPGSPLEAAKIALAAMRG
jgi:hypothetical protein